MKQLSVMIKPASSQCNLRCGYCFYADESKLRSAPSLGTMTAGTVSAVLANLFADLAPGDRLTFAFQGGEPTLAGLPYFRQFTAEVSPYAARGVAVSYALQTNGLLLDDDWCAFLKAHRFLVGLSLDGPGDFHNANRKDPQGQGTFRRVLAAKERMDRAGVEYNILAVLTGQLARHPRQVWNFLLEQNIRFVQFIPCLGPLEGGVSPAALTPERYADFYTALFDLWEQAWRQGTYRSVKLFDDLIRLLAFGQCNACGLLGRCQAQLIVEADGSVYPCDFYALDDWKAGNLGQQPLRAVYESPVMARFVNREVPLPDHCQDCPYAALCGGGCPRMRREVFGLGGRVCGHRLFLDHRGPQLQQLALLARRAARP